MPKAKINVTKTIDDLTKMIRTPNYDKGTILRLSKRLKQMSPIGFKLLLKQIQTDEEDNSKSILEGALSKASSNADHENFKSPSGFSTESKGISKMHKQHRFRDPRQQQRFSKTAEVLKDSGLLEVAIKTANLAKESRQIEKDLRKLRSESEAFHATVAKTFQAQREGRVSGLEFQLKPTGLFSSIQSFQVNYEEMEPTVPSDESLNIIQYLK